MTVFTDIGRLDVRRSLARGIRAVMAARAIVNDVRMVEVRRRPGNGGMTIIAILAARNVCRMFPYCDDAIVASATGADDLRMVYCKSGYPNRRIVAVFADVRRVNMCRVLAGGVGTVMTACAVAGDIDVIKVCRQPGNRRMAILAIITAANVRRMLASRQRPIMAASTGTQDLGMVDRVHRRKHIAGVTIFAYVGRLNVCRVFASGIDAIVAANAVSSDVDVIKICWQPSDR